MRTRESPTPPQDTMWMHQRPSACLGRWRASCAVLRTSWRRAGQPASSTARAAFGTVAAHRLVAQQVQGRVVLAAQPPEALRSKTHVVFVSQEQSKPEHTQALLPFKTSKSALKEFTGRAQTTQFVYPSDDDKDLDRVLLVGLGAQKRIDALAIRNATHTAVQTARGKHLKDMLLQVPTLPEMCSLKESRVVELMTQAAMLSNYQFNKYRHGSAIDASNDAKIKTDKKLQLPLERILLATGSSYQSIIEEQNVVAEETLLARNLGNERSDVVTPLFMEEVAKACLELPNMRLRVLQQEELEAANMNMFVSVGQAATVAPRLVVLEYMGNPEAPNDKIALVGKGITFDTGGLNLKPTGYMEDMHTDMCGAAAVLSATRAIARQGIKANIVCAMALAENAIGSKAVKPHTIMRSHKGISVENSNTDAEGRLVLADTLSFVQAEYKPKQIIDVATLTGACMVALGEHCAGLFSNSDTLASKLLNSGDAVYERCWRLPILPEHTDALKSEQADSRSTSKGRYGGACTAAAFLQKFIEKDIDWAHLDIAGPSNYSSAKSYFPFGATGFGVQLLYQYIKNQASA